MPNQLTHREIRPEDLRPGDLLVFLNKGYRVTRLVPYSHPTVDGCFAIAHVEGHGPFMSLWHGQPVRVAA